MVDLVCVRAFGNFLPGDFAGSVADDASYLTDYFAPADGSPPPPPSHVLTHDEQIAALEAELEGLEKENQ